MSLGHPGAPWLLLLVPGAICALAFARWLMFDQAAATVHRRWLALAGALLFGIAGLVAALSGAA